MKSDLKEKILTKLLTAFVLACLLALAWLGSVCIAETGDGTTRIGESGDILFYIIIAVLVVVLVAICVIFSKSKKFVIRERERINEINKEVPPAKEIRVYDEEYVKARDALKKAQSDQSEVPKEDLPSNNA